MKNIIVSALVSIGISSAVFAAEEQNESEELNTIIITATRSEQSKVVTPVSLKVITQQEIVATGANSLTEVLRTQPSIQIKDQIGDGSRAYVSMRGFGENSSSNVLIVVDGRKLNNPTLEVPLLSSISLKDIERIEIVQGSGGVLYGDQAVGGVINIITKKFQGNKLYVETTQGSHELKSYKTAGSQQFDNGIGYRISAEDKQADNYRDNNESEYRNYFGEIGYDGQWGNAFYERSYVDDKLNLPGSLSESEIKENPRQTNTPNDYFNNKTTIDRLGAVYILNNNISIDSAFSLRDTDSVIENYGFSEQDTTVRIFDVKALGDWNLEKGKMLATTGYEIIDSKYQKTGPYSSNWESSQESFYGQLVYPLVKALSGVVGVRTTQVKDENLQTNKSNKDNATATELGLNFQLDGSRYFLRRAESFRFGKADENGLTLSDVEFLKPQKSISYELGYEYSGKTFITSVLIYSMDLKNEIYFDPDLFVNINLNDSRRRGLIADFEKTFNSKLKFGAGINIMDSKYRSGSFDGNNVPGVPDKTATLFSSYKISGPLTFYVDAIYTGSRYLNGDESNQFPKLDSYTLVNLNLNWRQGSWDTSFRINNLTDKEYTSYQSQYGGYPAAQRTYELNISYELY